MAELDIRRVVVACDAACEIEIAVDSAAALAARWGVPVHGVFLRDGGLLRLAELPFSRQVSLSVPGVAEGISPEGVETLLAALAAGMRRALAAAASREDLAWSFAEAEDLAAAADEGDMLVVQASARAFSGSWRPHSPWEGLAAALGGVVLLRRAAAASERRRVALVLRAGDEAPARLLAAGRAFAGPRDRIAVLVLGEASLDEASLRRSLARSGLDPHRIEAVADAQALRRRLGALDPALVILETPLLDAAALRDLLAATCGDVLLLG
jgi:predicted component of type VI protein secretion system